MSFENLVGWKCASQFVGQASVSLGKALRTHLALHFTNLPYLSLVYSENPSPFYKVFGWMPTHIHKNIYIVINPGLVLAHFCFQKLMAILSRFQLCNFFPSSVICLGSRGTGIRTAHAVSLRSSDTRGYGSDQGCLQDLFTNISCFSWGSSSVTLAKN